VGYSFGENALSLTLKQTKPDGDQRPRDISIATLLDDLEGNDFQIEDILTVVSVTTDEGSFELRGPLFHLEVALAILEMQKKGIKPFASEWFWFDSSVSDSEPRIRYSFFAVYQDTIVREEISFVDSPGSGFDPTIFDSEDDPSNSSGLFACVAYWFRWFLRGARDSSWKSARAAYWYRRFYRETRIGQIMVLSPDSPLLHYYPEGRPWQLLRDVRYLLWAAIALLALIVFLLIRK
jgi:hypothetical protein